jgi:plastocyanin
MPRWVRYSLFPAAVAFAALFIVLPQTGADATVKITGPSSAPSFSPTVRSVAAGARIAFENDTRQTQTATCLNCSARTSWDSGDIQPGQTVFVTLPDVRAAFDYASRYDESLQGKVLAGVAEEAATSPSPSAS